MSTDSVPPDPSQPLSAERQEEFVLLLNAAHGLLLRYVMSLVANRHDAEDVLQRASLVMWRRFGTFEAGTDLIAWATTVAFYEARNFQRVTGRSRLMFDDELMHTLAAARVEHVRHWSRRTEALEQCVVRLAHENGNLYVQVIKFDDVVTMHQPLAKHYLQDSVEFCVNSYLHGFKFNVTRTQEHGDTVFRDRFFVTKFNKVYTAAEVPRSIRVLDNAADVEERKLIESIYGVDLAQGKVIVTEFKLPMEKAFEGDPKAGPTGKSGDTMWIGFMLDDNDVPGSDVQDLLVYPATYGTFALKERGCLATFEWGGG